MTLRRALLRAREDILEVALADFAHRSEVAADAIERITRALARERVDLTSLGDAAKVPTVQAAPDTKREARPPAKGKAI